MRKAKLSTLLTLTLTLTLTQVAPMRKAKLSTLRGQASTVLSPHHTELQP